MDYKELEAHRTVLLDLYESLGKALDKEGDKMPGFIKQSQKNIKAEKFLLAIVGEGKAGKSTLERFDTDHLKECVLDYMIDLSDTVSLAKTLSTDYDIENLIPISRDPFGNLITFRIAGRQVDGVVFWEHETNKISKISGSFTEFIEKLY